MMRFFILLFLFSLVQKATSQSITCPPDATVKCYDNFISDPIIEDGESLDLSTSFEYSGSNCDTFNIKVKYTLSDSVEVTSCFTTLTIIPYNETILFPRDTTVYGIRLADVYRQPVFNERMFPNVIGECNIEFTFKDIIVESFPTLNVFRDWTAKNLCTNEETKASQHIKLMDLPNGSLRTQVSDCRGNKLKVDSLSIMINGTPVDWVSCLQPYDSLFQVLNCVAEEYNLDTGDEMEVELHNVLDQLAELSTYDILVIQRHIIGFERFTTDCQRYAADVNRDGRINGIDLVELRKFILGIYSEWPAAYGYRPEILINGETTRESLTFSLSDFPLQDLQITLSKQGDVDRGN